MHDKLAHPGRARFIVKAGGPVGLGYCFVEFGLVGQRFARRRHDLIEDFTIPKTRRYLEHVGDDEHLARKQIVTVGTGPLRCFDIFQLRAVHR
jgi:hypothetical protein